jgi:hypothetical protein
MPEHVYEVEKSFITLTAEVDLKYFFFNLLTLFLQVRPLCYCSHDLRELRNGTAYLKTVQYIQDRVLPRFGPVFPKLLVIILRSFQKHVVRIKYIRIS